MTKMLHPPLFNNLCTFVVICGCGKVRFSKLNILAVKIKILGLCHGALELTEG